MTSPSSPPPPPLIKAHLGRDGVQGHAGAARHAAHAGLHWPHRVVAVHHEVPYPSVLFQRALESAWSTMVGGGAMVRMSDSRREKDMVRGVKIKTGNVRKRLRVHPHKKQHASLGDSKVDD